MSVLLPDTSNVTLNGTGSTAVLPVESRPVLVELGEEAFALITNFVGVTLLSENQATVYPADEIPTLVSEGDSAVLVNNIQNAPEWTYNTRIFVQSSAPANPKLNDVWIVKA